MSIARVSETQVREAELKRSARRTAATHSGGRGPRLPIKVADRYLLRQVIEATLRSLGWFAGLLLMFAVITAATKFAQQKLPLVDSMELIAYQMPRIIVFTLPMSVLQGTVQTFTDLSSKGEMTALWAGGMSFPRMLRTPLLWGALLGCLAFWMQEVVVPHAEQQRGAVLARQVGKVIAAQTNLKKVDLYPDNSVQRIIQAKHFDLKTGVLEAPRIQIYNRDRQLDLQIRAERAVWNIKTGQWKFYNGLSTKVLESGGSIKSPFQEFEVDAVPDPRALQPGVLTLREHLKNGDFEMVSITDLKDYHDSLDASLRTNPNGISPAEIRRLMNGAIFGIHDKIATPLICLALILVGAPLGVRPQRATGGFAMGLSLLVLLLYYVTWTLTSQLGKNGAINPYLMAYLPFGLTLLIGLTLVVKKSR